MMNHRASLFAIFLLCLLTFTSVSAQDDNSSDRDASHLLRVPSGFEVTVYAEGQNFGLPTQIAFGPDSHLYVLSLAGTIYRLVDTDGDDFAETIETAFWDGDLNFITEENVEQVADTPDQLFHAAGMAFRDNVLYVSDSGRISTLEDTDGDGTFDTLTPVVEGLVSLRYEGHSNNGIAFGPDDKLYVGVGATTDHGPLREPMEAAILRVNPDGSDLEVFATGLRNPYDLAFSPDGDLFTADNNATELDRSLRFIPPEELNHIREGEDYGFPRVHGQPPPGDASVGPVVEFYPSVVTAGLTYYADDAFPAFWRGGVYVAQWGSGADVLVNRGLLFGYAVVFVPLTKDENGDYRGDFLEFAASATGNITDFRPIDVTVGPDGALYMIDFFSSRVFRVTYTGRESMPVVEATPEAPPKPVFPPETLTLGGTLYNNGTRNAPACRSCHEGESSLGPSLRGLWQAAGSRVPGVDASEYIRRSITHPAAYLVEGYNNLMPPTYADALTGAEIDALVAYVITLEG